MTEHSSDNRIVWQPGEARIAATAMHRFMQRQGREDYADLHAWSIDEPAAFWTAIADFCDVQFDTANRSSRSQVT